MDTTKLPIDSIEGIGPARKAELEAVGIHYVCELLLVSPSAIASSSDLSMEMIEDWRKAALFLELGSMNTQWAEALVDGNVYDLKHLGDLSMEELNAIFAQAIEDQLINEAPDSETLIAMKIEATKHHYGAQLQGLVTDEAGNALENVHIAVGKQETETNSKGLWKMTEFVYSNSPPLFARKEGFKTNLTSAAPLDVDDWSTDLLTIELEAGLSEALFWDEYRGDELPPLVGYRAKQLILGIEDLRPRDIMKVTEYYKDGDIKLISIFRSMTNNQLNILCYRLAPGLFIEEPEVDSYWCQRSTGLTPLGLGDESVLVLKKMHNTPPPPYDPSAPWTQLFES